MPSSSFTITRCGRPMRTESHLSAYIVSTGRRRALARSTSSFLKFREKQWIGSGAGKESESEALLTAQPPTTAFRPPQISKARTRTTLN